MKIKSIFRKAWIRSRALFSIIFRRHWVVFSFRFCEKNTPLYIQGYNSGYISKTQMDFLLGEAGYLFTASAAVHRENDSMDSLVKHANKILVSPSPSRRGDGVRS